MMQLGSFGADVPALRTGLARLRTELAAANGGAAVRVLGSVFVPSKAWLAKMRFRCWVGTFLGAKDAPGGTRYALESESLDLCIPYEYFKNNKL